MDKKITIGIPIYNAERYLAIAIESIIAQSYQDWKLILIDDGSTDKSIEISKNFASKDHRISFYHDGQNKNLGTRLNEIARLADTEYLARMDNDDLMHPERIEKQLNTLLQHPEIDVLGTNAYTIDENGKLTGMRFDPQKNQDLMPVKSFVHPTIMGKTEWFRANPYDENAARIEDAELWLRTIHKSNFQILSEPLLYYREFGKNYYKKYLQGLPSLLHVLKKHKYNKVTVLFAGRYILSCIRCLLYFMVGKEHQMILSRNEIVY